jgi:hypothetical protein
MADNQNLELKREHKMKLNYTYKFEDYLAINNARDKNRKNAKTYQIILYFFILLNIAVSLNWLYKVTAFDMAWEYWMLINPFALLLLPFNFYVLRPWKLRRHYKLQLLDNKQVDFEITDKGVVSATDGHIGESDWTRIIKANEEERHFLLWVNHANAYSIPKRAFSSLEDEQYLRDMIAKHVI